MNEECVQCGRCEVGRSRVSRLVGRRVSAARAPSRAAVTGRAVWTRVSPSQSSGNERVQHGVQREPCFRSFILHSSDFIRSHSTSEPTDATHLPVPRLASAHPIGQRRGRQPTRDSAPSRRVFRAACLFGRHSAPARPDPPRPCTVLSLCLTPLSSLPEAAPSRALSACPCGQLVHPRVVTCAPPTLRSPPFHNARPLPAPHGSRMCEPPCRIRAREHMARTSTPPVHTHAPVTPRNSRTRHHPHLLASEL